MCVCVFCCACVSLLGAVVGSRRSCEFVRCCWWSYRLTKRLTEREEESEREGAKRDGGCVERGSTRLARYETECFMSSHPAINCYGHHFNANANYLYTSHSISQQIWWTALSVALGLDVRGDVIKGVPCIKRYHQLFCPTAGNSYPMWVEEDPIPYKPRSFNVSRCRPSSRSLWSVLRWTVIHELSTISS